MAVYDGSKSARLGFEENVKFRCSANLKIAKTAKRTLNAIWLKMKKSIKMFNY